MEYYLSNSDIFPSIKIRKDYKIRLCKSSKSIRILKKNNLYKQEGNYLRKIYNANTYLNAVEIHSQLSNIKHIGFEVTDSCNLKCTYCIYGELYKNHDLRSNKMIEWEKAKKLMDYLVDALFSSSNTTQKNIIYVSFYGGEPLLNMDFIKKMVNYTQSLSSSKIHFSYMMTSNAILLKKYIDFLQKYDFKVMISLDGDRENDGHRLFPNGKTSFDIVYSNVKYVQKNYPDYFNKNISFNSVINDLNNIYEIYSFIYKEFGKIPQISGINRIGLNDELKSKFEKISKAKPMNDKEVFVKRIDQALDLMALKYISFQNFLFSHSGNLFDNYNNLLEDEKNIKPMPSASCIPFSRRTFMTVNNKILPCERIGQQFYLGRVTDKGVEIDCEEVAARYNAYYNALKTQCEKCYHKLNCQRCMYDIPGFDKDPQCDDFVDEEAFSKELAQYMEMLRENPRLYRRFMTEILTVR